MDKLIHQNETYQIIGISMEVHRHLGFGFAEIIYKDALQIEVELAGLRMEREKEYEIIYKGRKLCHKYFADFVMFDNIIVEIKASCDGIADEHISQTLNYLKASGCCVGLIINFGKKSLEYKRLIL